MKPVKFCSFVNFIIKTASYLIHSRCCTNLSNLNIFIATENKLCLFYKSTDMLDVFSLSRDVNRNKVK